MSNSMETDKKILGWKKWKIGDWHLINRIQWGEEERSMLEKVLSDDWFGYGRINTEFEKKLSDFTGINYFNLTNSGSSAIEVAVKVLEAQDYWKKGDLVIHPITTFATSISSAISQGLTPVYIDTKRFTYVADPQQVKLAIEKHPEIKGMILPYLIGNIPDLDEIKNYLDGRLLIEDCCDTLGGKFGDIHLGNLGDFVTFSFYGSHHITTGGGGGALGTKDESLHATAKSAIYWGRDFKDKGGDFLKRYEYETLGTNSQMPSLNAAFGSAQIDRLPGFIKARERQFSEMTELFGESGYFHLPIIHKKAKPSFFAYPLTLKEDCPFNRAELVRYLRNNKVEVRPLMCGNIMHQKPFRKARGLALTGEFPVADEIQEKSFFAPCWGMPEEQKEDYYAIFKNFFSRYAKSTQSNEKYKLVI